MNDNNQEFKDNLLNAQNGGKKNGLILKKKKDLIFQLKEIINSPKMNLDMFDEDSLTKISGFANQVLSSIQMSDLSEEQRNKQSARNNYSKDTPYASQEK